MVVGLKWFLEPGIFRLYLEVYVFLVKDFIRLLYRFYVFLFSLRRQIRNILSSEFELLFTLLPTDCDFRVDCSFLDGRAD